MTIKAVVLDIGGVLEVIDDSVFPGPWEARLGLDAGGFARVVSQDGLMGDPALGEVSESDVSAHWARCLQLDEPTTAALLRDYWRWYVGTLDRELFDWFARLRPRYLTALLSNSGPGAREHEAGWGFEAVTDDILYSHEVGLAKPDPAIFTLAASRLGVSPSEIVFLDDTAGHVEAARKCGWRAVLHTDARRSIIELERVLESP